MRQPTTGVWNRQPGPEPENVHCALASSFSCDALRSGPASGAADCSETSGTQEPEDHLGIFVTIDGEDRHGVSCGKGEG